MQNTDSIIKFLHIYSLSISGTSKTRGSRLHVQNCVACNTGTKQHRDKKASIYGRFHTHRQSRNISMQYLLQRRPKINVFRTVFQFESKHRQTGHSLHLGYLQNVSWRMTRNEMCRGHSTVCGTRIDNSVKLHSIS